MPANINRLIHSLRPLYLPWSLVCVPNHIGPKKASKTMLNPQKQKNILVFIFCAF
jgi:hypothetical protein